MIWLVIGTVLLAITRNFDKEDHGTEVNYTEFVSIVKNNSVDSVIFDGAMIYGKMRNSKPFYVVRPNAADNELINDLLKHNVKIVGTRPEQPSLLQQLLIASFPLLLIILLFMLFMRQMNGSGSGKIGPMSFGRSKARLLNQDQIKTTFADVAGIDEAKEDLEEVVEFLKAPSRYEKLGGEIPHGVLMIGPPGTGKTLLAKAIAGEAQVPFFSISGSDFVEMFVGVGASRVRDMFEQAKKQAPCIIFIDEIDAVGRHRGGGWGGGNDEREQTLNQMLVEMDGFESNQGVIVIAATNRSDVLDHALLRPGRFDRQVHIGLPDIRGREKILQVHSQKLPLSDSVRLGVIARGTPGFSGADLANLVNEAALVAARYNKSTVGAEEFERARDKIMMGAERKSMVMSEKDRTITAYHEAGHAIVGWLMPEHDPIHKVSIIPRGGALGVTQFLPEQDRYSYNRLGLISQISSLFGGRIAEQLTGGNDAVTTGASNDIERATQLARNMVTKWGLSEKLGTLMYGDEESNSIHKSKNYSDSTSSEIDQEVRRIIDECYKQTHSTLVENRDILETMKDALMEYETIDQHQVADLMARRPVGPPKDWGSDFGDPSNTSSSLSSNSSDPTSDVGDDTISEPARS